MSESTRFVQDGEECVDQILQRLGPQISIGMPLGLGKPTQLINSLYRRAKADPSVKLRILTALSLEKPQGSSTIEKAFLRDFLERLYADCPDLEYVQDLAQQQLPPNVEVFEFFFKPGSRLRNGPAQQHYISSNYTHAARDVFEQGCNLAAQLICRSEDGQHVSLSANPDTSPELLRLLKASGRPHMVVGEANQNLPYMAADAEVPANVFDLILENPGTSSTLFSTPKMPVALADHAIGLQASSLIADGGTLQIGIGALGDAIVHACCLRQTDNKNYQRLLQNLRGEKDQQALIDNWGGLEPFRQGLYGATEMFVDGFMNLYQAGILSRQVYDDEHLQTLLNQGRVGEELDTSVLDGLEELGERVIRSEEFKVLQHHGLFRDDCEYDLGHIIAPDGERIMANLAIPESRQKLAEKCLGKRLRNGILLHGGFFLGPQAFYDWLRDMNPRERAQFVMTGVDKINQLDCAPALYKAQRQHARFINTGIMATLSGAVVSDGLDNGQVISGVGGQYNFVAMAHQLPTGRSILLVRAVREKDNGEAQSNIVASYGHCTIPRHLRDIVITEYGIADLRSRSDAEVAQAMIQVADSRFQDELIAQAKAAGKLPSDFSLAPAYRRNTPDELAKRLGDDQAFLPEFPLGCDFTTEELELMDILKSLKRRAAQTPRWRLALKALRSGAPHNDRETKLLQRLDLAEPRRLEDKVTRRLLLEQIRQMA